jgi:hypothetical protein
MELEHTAMAYNHIEAHSQQGGHKDESEDIGVKSRNEGR